jgi:hypothetical protein
LGREFSEKFKPFSAKAVFELGKAGGVAAWSRQTIDEACTNRIKPLCEYDWYSVGRLS